MDVSLNVLILEDNPADAELAAEELRKAGLSFQWRRVQTERDYLAALDSGLDLILADHSLPQYDSVRALEALKHRALDVPFIVVSGSIDEELAVTLMKRGAADYLLKDRLARLGQAVVHALAEKKVRQERRRAEQSLVLFRTLLDRTNDAIEIIDPATGRFLDVNERACTTHGYTRAEYLSMTVLDIETTLAAWPPAAMQNAQQTGSFIAQGVHRRKDGSTFPVEVNVNCIRLERDYVVAVVRDVTERREAEATLRASEERFRRITTNMLDMVSQTDAAGIVQYATPSNEQALGYPLAAIVGKSTFAFLHPEDRARALAMFQTALATQVPGGGEFRFRHAEGHYLWLECVGNVLIDDNGKACGTILASRDITERKRRDEQMRLQAAALEAAANGIVITDKKGNITWVNQAYTSITGYALAEVRGKNPRILKSGKHGPEFYRNLWTTILAENIWRGEVVNRRKDGTLYFDEMTITPVCAGGSGITHFVAVKQDVTERKRAEDTLRLSEEHFRNAFEFAGVSMGIMDLRGRFLQVNPSCCRMLGYSESELLGNTFQEISHPDDVAADLEKMAELLAGKIASYQIEKRNLHKSGRILWVLKTASLVRDAAGQPWQILAQVQDITARKQAEQALYDSEERFALAIEGANDGIWDWQLDTNEIYLSPRWKAMIGYQDHELANRYEEWEQRLHPADRAGILAQLNDYLEGRSQSYQPEFRLRHKDGSYRWILARAAAHRDASGKPTRLTGSHTDITRRKQAEDELRALNAELEQRVRNRTIQLEAANKELESFAYSVSHDLRAPLRAIDGFSQALLEDYHDKLDVAGQDCLRRVRAATQRMGHLIDDILQLSRLTRAAMTREQVNLSALAARVVAELQAAEPARHDVCFDIAPVLFAEGDARLLEVVLTNLLGNAWKFTSQTKNARIECGAMEHAGQQVFFVRDNGAGFDMANADRLFGAFQRLHSEAEFPGTGIGLATVQRIVRRHGGQVWAEGAVGKGATFSFTLGPPERLNSHA